MRPGIDGIGSRIERQITDNLYSPVIRVLLHCGSLGIEEVLYSHPENNIFLQSLRFIPDFLTVVNPEFLRPLQPCFTLPFGFDRHEDRIVLQPFCFLTDKRKIFLRMNKRQSVCRLTQDIKSVFIQNTVIRVIRFLLPLYRLDFLRLQKSVFRQFIEINQIRIAGKRRK